MVQKGNLFRKKRKFGAVSAKQKLFIKVMAAVEKVDFISLAKKVAHSDMGRPWLNRNKEAPEGWPDQEGLRKRALELTLDQLKDENGPVDPVELTDLIGRISCRHDHETYIWATTAATVLLNILFNHDIPQQPFTSKDGRDLAHLDLLKSYQEKGLGVLYLANHSSHLDEFLVAGLLTNHGLKLPVFAAGQNMMAIKSLAKVLMLASYVVQRRGAGRHKLAALYNFCRAISDIGGQQGIFLEAWHGGARSRDGSLRYPRRLVTLRGALATEKDLVIQPVALSYAVVPEDLSLAAGKGPRCWVRGMGLVPTLGQALLHPLSFYWRAARGLYQRAYVTMPKPLLLSELKEAHAKDPGGLHLDEFVALMGIRESARCKKVMTSQLVARGLSRARRLGGGDFKAAVEYELDLLREYHQTTFGQEPDLEDFISEHTMAEVLSEGLGTLKKRGIIARSRTDMNGLPQVLSEAGLSFYATHGDRRIYSPTADENIVVVDAGDLGFALTYLVGNRMLEEKRYLNASLTLFESRPELAAELGDSRRPLGRFEEYNLPKNSFVTSDATSAFRKASEVILASPPSELIRQAGFVLENSERALKLVVATCGFEPESHKLPCQAVMELVRSMGRRDVEVYAWAGPMVARDMVEGNPSFGILAGPDPGLKKMAHLFRYAPIGVEISPDPLGVQAAVILARVYALWGQFASRTGQISGSAQIGLYMSKAGAEAMKLSLALGGRPETFSVASPAWTATLTADALSLACREFTRGLADAARQQDDVPAAARKLNQEMENKGLRMQAYHDLRSALIAANEHNLDLPILSEANQTIWVE